MEICKNRRTCVLKLLLFPVAVAAGLLLAKESALLAEEELQFGAALRAATVTFPSLTEVIEEHAHVSLGTTALQALESSGVLQF